MSLFDNVINLIKKVLNKNESDQGNNQPNPVTQNIPEPIVEPQPEFKTEPESVVETQIDPEPADIKPEIKADSEPDVKINPAKPLAEHMPEQAVIEEIEQLINENPIATQSNKPKMNIPEDSSLRRHFLCNLQADVEAELPPRPADSTLKRHYDAEVKAKLDSLLS